MELERPSITHSTNDYQQLAVDLIRLLRGEVSQRSLSEMLGYSYNQVGKWESGFTRIKWNDFLDLAAVLKIPIERHFRTVFWTFDGAFDGSNTVRALVNQLNIKVDTARGGRMDFAEILKLIDSKPTILMSWLSLFVDCEKLPTIGDAYKAFLLHITAILSDPLCVFVNAALELDGYKNRTVHDEVYLAEHAACSVEELRKTLATLVTFEAAVFDGRKYRPTFRFEYSFSPNPKLRALTKYATDLAASRYSLLPVGVPTTPMANVSVSSVRVVPMSAELSRKIRDMVVQFHAEVGQLVKNDSQTKDHVQVMILHSFVSNINRPTENMETNS